MKRSFALPAECRPEFARRARRTLLRAAPEATSTASFTPPQFDGNQTALRSIGIRAKLNVSQPGDADEREADRMADAFVDGRTIRRKCAGCDDDEIKRKADGARHTAVHGSSMAPALAGLHGSAGHPMPPPMRRPYERFFGTDLSHVRMHDNAAAAHAAKSINAQAFTHGANIYFSAGRGEQGTDGRRLLAHELAHTLQDSPVIARKNELDATNKQLWGQFGTASKRKTMPDIYGRLIAGAPGASLAVQENLKDAGAPKTDAEREVLKRRLEALVRVNAIGLMASHRAGVERRRDVTLGSEAEEGDTRSAATTEKETATQIRGAIDKMRHLRGVRDELKDFRSGLNGVRADSIRSLTFPVDDWFETIAENSGKYLSPDKRKYLLERSQTATQIKDKKIMRLFVYFMAESLMKWREKQIEGATSAIDLLFKAYPFFTQWEDFLSTPAMVVGPVDDRKMMQEVAKAYAQLLDKIDDATVRIGSGDIEPFDLPVPTEQAKNDLPEDLRKELESIIKEREVAKFRNELLAGGAMLALVFIPVIGPALAATVGVGMLAMTLEDMLDKVALSGASTNEQGITLGVSGPKDYEWAMLAVGAALTIADLGMVARQFRAGKSLSHAADELLPKPRAHDELHGTGSSKTGEPQTPAKVLGPEERLTAGKELLEKTKPKQTLAHDEARQELELAQVQGTQRAPTKDGYIDEYSTPGDHGHVWRKRKDGGWCRWSHEGVCYISPGQRDTSLAPVGYELKRPKGELPTLGQGEVIELPTGERVWRSKPVTGEDQATMIESKLGPGTKRQKFEQDMFSRGEMDPAYVKSNMERAHSQGAGTGHENPYAITYAPAEVNQALQNTGIELYLREMVKRKPKGVDYHLVTGTTVHSGSKRLKSITYRVDVSVGGNRRRMFEVKIEVSDAIKSPNVRITEPWINPDPSLIGGMPLNELPGDIAGRLRYIFSKGATFPVATPPQ